MSTIKNNIKYAFLQAFYWMLYCAVFGYATVYMTETGISASVIGVVIAIAGILGALLQPVVGRIVDAGKTLTLHKAVSLFAIFPVFGALILLLTENKLLTAALYILLMVATHVMMPLTNATSFYMERNGQAVDFGKCRSMGSLAYAAISSVIGSLVVRTGISAVTIAVMIVSAGVFIAMHFIPNWEKEKIAQETLTAEDNAQNALEQNRENRNLHRSFAKKYPRFLIFIAGTVLLFVFHNITNLYLFQMMEAVGGNSADMGVSLSIAAVLELPAMIFFATLHKKFRLEHLLVISGVAYVLKGILFLCASSVLTIHLAQILQMASFALYTPASVHFAEKEMQPEDKTTGQTMITAGITAGAVLGSLLGGVVLDYAGIHTMLVMSVCFAVAGAVLLGVSCLQAQKKNREV